MLLWGWQLRKNSLRRNILTRKPKLLKHNGWMTTDFLV
jgi:hypothetical protein